MSITFSYPDGKLMVFEMRIWSPYGLDGTENGVEVYGSDGMVHFDGGYTAYDARGKEVAAKKYTRDYHARNFINCIRTRQNPDAEIEQGHISSLHAHLGNIVGRLGRPVRFDAQTESIPGDEEANALLRRKYRDHWSTPHGV
jgi:predicted dehydrogenase